MKHVWFMLFVVSCMALALSVPAIATEGIIDTVAKGCDKDQTTYCGDVTVGEGRGLACLYA